MTGLEHRYHVERIRENGREPLEDDVFVLRPERDPLARGAIRHYAEGLPADDPLGSDLREWMHQIEGGSK